MTIPLDATHDPARKSWVEAANDPACPFPIQNLPFGVFSRSGEAVRRIGVAIGDQVLDMAVLAQARLLPEVGDCLLAPVLNPFMAQGPAAWRDVRRTLSSLLSPDNGRLRDDADLRAGALVPLSSATMHLPFEVAGFTDFYSSREHATNVGKMFRGPDKALMPNWLHIPIAYNGRASTVVVSGTGIHRPLGQTKAPDAEAPSFGPCAKLDIELEMGVVVGMPSRMGTPIPIDHADNMIFGFVLLNDWSARDIQVWEYQPLGPFQSKAFATTISPWVVTNFALAPFRAEGPVQAPTPLPYLRQADARNYDIELEVALQPAGGSATTISRTNFRHMYWSSAQQLVHHAAGGCAMRTGDLLGSGTISGPDEGSFGSLLELTWNGQNPIALADGGTRTFIEDGDTLTLTGWAQGDGHRIGFGEATGTVLPAVAYP